MTSALARGTTTLVLAGCVAMLGGCAANSAASPGPAPLRLTAATSTESSEPGRPVAPPTRVNSAPKAETTKYSSSAGDWRTAGWITLGFAGVAAVVAGGTSYLMLHHDHVRGADCNADKQCNSNGFAANSKLSSLIGWNIGAWAVTGVAAGVGTILVLTHPSKTREPQRQTSVGVGPGALTLRSTF